MTDDEFLCAFEECTLERKDWTHAAHVRMAWLYLTRIQSVPGTLDRVRGGIKKLNASFISRLQASGVLPPEKAPDPRGLDGYHETITVAFVTVIASRIRAGEDFAAFRERNADLFDRKFPALLKHYTSDRLYSSMAKSEFLEPDLEPLPAV
jgi:hypothetical protein